MRFNKKKSPYIFKSKHTLAEYKRVMALSALSKGKSARKLQKIFDINIATLDRGRQALNASGLRACQ